MSLTVCSCNEKPIDEKTAVKIYVENIIAEEKYSNNPDSLSMCRDKIFSKYDVTRENFENYFHDMNTESDKWKSFFKESDLYLAELQKKGLLK